MRFIYCTDHHIDLITELHTETRDIARHGALLYTLYIKPIYFAKQRGSRGPIVARDITTCCCQKKIL